MKLSTAQSIIAHFENAIGFLTLAEISRLNNLLSASVDKLSFKLISQLILDKFYACEIDNKILGQCITIIANANPLLKIN